MKGRLKGGWILSLLLVGLFQPSLGQEQQEILTGLQLSHQYEEAKPCSYAPSSQPPPDQAKVDCYDSVQGSAHDYGAISLTGEYISFRNYVGKYILFGLGNQASHLLVQPFAPKKRLQRYVHHSVFSGAAELNALQNSLKADQLVILGFPCNQFGKQEPGRDSEILQGIKHVRPGGGYVPNFQLFQKGDVNGENEQKIYTFLKNSCPPVVETFGDPAKLFWSPLKIHDIKWNFEKFLVNPQGKPVMRWFPRTNVSTVKNDIIKYMKADRNG